MPVTRCKVEISPDPISVVLPRYFDVSPHLKEIEWWRGKERELDGIQSGGAKATFDNDERRFEPGYLGTSYALTASGNEVTDAVRATGTSGDMRPLETATMIAACDLVAEVTLAADMTSGTTTMTIDAWPEDADGNSLWPENTAFRVMVDKETMLVTAGWGTNTLTVTRGVAQRWASAQAAAAHTAGATVSNFFDGWMLGTVATKAYSLGGIPTDQIEVQGDVVRTGDRAWKMTVRPGDYDNAADTTRERAEMSRLSLGELGERWYHRWSTYLPEGYHANDTSPGAYIFQLGPAFGTGSPALAIRTNVGLAGPDPHEGSDWFRLVFATGVDVSGSVPTFTDQYDLCPAEEGIWHDFIVYVDWDLADGTVRIMHRKGSGEWEVVFEISGVPTSQEYSGSTPSVQRRHGIYRTADASLTNYLYLDNVRAARTFAEVLDLPSLERSVGIWPAATNLLPDDTFTAAGTAVVAADATRPLFGVSSKRVDFLATSDYAHRTFSGLTIGQTYTASLWVYRSEVDARLLTFAVRNAANSANVASVNVRAVTGWQRVEVTWTAAETSGRIRLILTDTVNKPVRVWLGASQVELQVHATPYTPVGTVRGAGRVRAPASLVDETQMWAAFRVRAGADSTALIGDRFLSAWEDGGGGHIYFYWDGAAGKFAIERHNASDATHLGDTTDFIKREDLTIIFAMTATHLRISVNGEAFTETAGTQIPTLAATLFDIGSSAGASHFPGDYRWVAFGTGTLDDTDAATLHALGNDPPWAPDLADLGVTTVWDGTSADVAGGNLLDLMRRMRVTLLDDTREAQQGVYFLTDPSLAFRGGSKSTEVTLAFTDGQGKRGIDRLPRMDPPDATSYDEVVTYDDPIWYGRHDEPEGNKIVRHIRRKRRRHKGESKRHYRRHGFRRWKTRETRAEVEGQSGTGGTYKNTPTLAQPGAIVGDSDRSVLYTRANHEYAVIPFEDADDAVAASLSIEAWVYPLTLPGTMMVIAGPSNSVTGQPIWYISINATSVTFDLPTTLGSVDATYNTPLPTNQWSHLVGVSELGNLSLYINGVEVATGSSGGPLTPDGPAKMYLAGNSVDPETNNFNGRIDESAFYGGALSADRVLAHYNAGALLGYPVQTAGERIAALSESDLWDTDLVQTTGYDVQPIFQFGQSPLGEIEDAVAAEMPHSLYYFNGSGKPIYLPVGYKADAPYDTVQAVFSDHEAADPGDIRYGDLRIDWDKDIYNIVPASKDGGLEQLAIDATSVAERGELTFDGAQGLLNNDDVDVLAIAETIRDEYSEPVIRPNTLALHGADEDQREQIFERDIGDLITVKRAADVGDPHQANVRILGWKKRYAGTQVTATYNLSRAE